jgi:hypothetical protein
VRDNNGSEAQRQVRIRVNGASRDRLFKESVLVLRDKGGRGLTVVLAVRRPVRDVPIGQRETRVHDER